ncbi:low temperature requirement protein A [Micromonospora sp. C97]|uniref:low temperature requirement protein A n=1 Tax=Micromonospora sp. C97 TaxID=2824883 RepID=UPI001B378DC6|nr:low temperature requirement protein A [Micromonospora sp. C97]MBQ1032243.1 low temperature requirement protein A [Micromonospora sp. C97]
MGHPRTAPETGTADGVTLDEVFFDVVFVLTVTQLASALETHSNWAGFGSSALIFGLLWYLYTGYAWLNNHLPPRRNATRLMLFTGMAGFLLTAVALPDALTHTGALFALGESVVAIGMGVPTEDLTAGKAAAIVLALALPVALWWTYFTDTRPAEAALAAAAPATRTRLAARAYVLPHFLLLIGVIATVSGLHAAVAHPDEPATPGAALALSGGVALYLIGITATRRALRLPLPLSRPTTALAALATTAVGPALAAPAQLVAVTGVVVLMLVTDTLRA